MVIHMNWITPLHSKNAVKRAAKIISRANGTSEDRKNAKDILGNFRSAHAYPLWSITSTVRLRAQGVNRNAIVAQRLKRLPTVLDKLSRFPNMSITTMQDFGGCRAILTTVDDVYTLRDRLVSAKRARNKIIREDDYIRGEPGPKNSGYRGIHLVYEYRAAKAEFQGLKVELQIRTDLQHAWATAVETMDLFSLSELKYSKGDPKVIRYFLVASALMAIHEGAPPPELANRPREELRREIRDLDRELNVLSQLESYVSVVGSHAHTDRRSALTLELDRREKRLTISSHETQAQAEARLRHLEALNDENLDVVLVATMKIGQLKSAFPNYYADTTSFTEFLVGEMAT